jgi:hypothetical protein
MRHRCIPGLPPQKSALVARRQYNRAMLNARSLEAVAAANFTPPFIRPLYDSYNFYRLPHTIVNLLAGGAGPTLPPDTLPHPARRYDAVILVLIDGFGWRFFERYAGRYPFLQHFVQHGVVSKLTAMFPSTTASHVTCLHTGLAPAQSGVYEWHQYAPALNALIAPLLFSFAGDIARDTLTGSGLMPAGIFPPRTLYQRLARSGVESYAMQSNLFARSEPSRQLLQGARILPIKTAPEGLVRLGKLLAAQEQPGYYMLYLAHMDSICHDYGPASDEVDAEIDILLIALERHVLNRLAGRRRRAAQRVLLIVTADHGQVEIDPATTFYLNRDSGLRGVRRWLQTDRNGAPLAPAGSPRDLFLHVQPDRLDAAQRALSRRLEGRALVLQTRALIEQAFFGPQPASDEFLARVGNLVILPFKGESVYWYERGRFEQKYFGHHGGLTREEMEIPLLVCEL